MKQGRREAGRPDDLEQRLERFELAWQSGAPPAIAAFLPAGPALLPLLHELIKIDLEYRWRRPAEAAGSLPARPLLNDYAEQFPQLGPPEHFPVELIGEEYRVRQRWGDRPGHAEYTRRFPGDSRGLKAELARIDAELEAELATECARGRAGRPRRASRSAPTRLRCPHCRQVIDIDDELPARGLACPACGGTFSVESFVTRRAGPASHPARRLGRYELGELLGSGAFGSVWQAWDAELNREVAVKLPRDGQLCSPEEEERFLREARSAALLDHPGIVAIHDVGRQDGTLYIVSELVRGVSLADRLRTSRLSFRESAGLVAQVADALHHAHRHGIVHRDVKPSNILLSAGQAFQPGSSASEDVGLESLPYVPQITDFGLAKRDFGEVTMTLDGQVLGTPAYMSPEQVRDPHTVDGRSDVYSLGVILYELLTGEMPFRGTARMLLVQVVSDEPRPPRQLNDRIPHDLETICLKCLRKAAGQRYHSAGELAADLRRWLAGEPILARPAGRAERLWLWLKRHPGLAAAGALGAVGLVAVTGAPSAVVLAAVGVASFLYALRKARAAAELRGALEDVRQQQKKSADTLRFAIEHCALAREERDRARAAETSVRRRLARALDFLRPLRPSRTDGRSAGPGAAGRPGPGLSRRPGPRGRRRPPAAARAGPGLHPGGRPAKGRQRRCRPRPGRRPGQPGQGAGAVRETGPRLSRQRPGAARPGGQPAKGALPAADAAARGGPVADARQRRAGGVSPLSRRAEGVKRRAGGVSPLRKAPASGYMLPQGAYAPRSPCAPGQRA